jgi:hypothetical protein
MGSQLPKGTTVNPNIPSQVAGVQILLLAWVLAWSPSTEAQTVHKRLSLNPYGAEISQGSSPGPGARFGTGFGSGSGFGAIVMPNPAGGISKLSLGFTLPDDYAPGTDIFLHVVWRSQAINCIVDLRDNFLFWARPGEMNRSGALISQSAMLAPGDSRIAAQTRYRFNFVPPGAFVGGDAFVFGLFRSPSQDTCAGDLFIQGVSIEYEALTSEVFADGFERTA